MFGTMLAVLAGVVAFSTDAHPAALVGKRPPIEHASECCPLAPFESILVVQATDSEDCQTTFPYFTSKIGGYRWDIQRSSHSERLPWACWRKRMRFAAITELRRIWWKRERSNGTLKIIGRSLTTILQRDQDFWNIIAKVLNRCGLDVYKGSQLLLAGSPHRANSFPRRGSSAAGSKQSKNQQQESTLSSLCHTVLGADLGVSFLFASALSGFGWYFVIFLKRPFTGSIILLLGILAFVINKRKFRQNYCGLESYVVTEKHNGYHAQGYFNIFWNA